MAQAEKKAKPVGPKHRNGKLCTFCAKVVSAQRQAEFEKWADLFYRHTGRKRPGSQNPFVEEDHTLELQSGGRPKRKEPE